MKRHTIKLSNKLRYMVISILLLNGCGLLDEYSLDLVTPKTMTHLNETILGSGYIRPREIKDMAEGDHGWWLNILDDDINTPSYSSATAPVSILSMLSKYYGYTTWQQEVDKNYKKNSTGTLNMSFWSTMYQRINVMNILLAEVDKIELILDNDYKDADRFKGECLFLRAQFYFMLVNVYADAYVPKIAEQTLGVPLKITEYVESGADKKFVRNNLKDVYSQIVNDLNKSIECFKRAPQIKGIHRASEGASLILLSRVYLHMQRWNDAKETAKDFVERYGTLNYLNVTDDNLVMITESSKEVVFSQGSLNIPNNFSAIGGDFCISSDLYNLYDDSDARKSICFMKNNLSDSISLNRKYKMDRTRTLISDVYMLRTAEGYLNAAEACAMLGESGDANRYLNDLKRARILNYNDQSLQGEELVNEVRNERRRELVLEGHRWFDLRRYSVCEKFPCKKDIVRYYVVYDDMNRNQYIQTEQYILKQDDKSYTFAIPTDVLIFDLGIESNIRDVRKPSHIFNDLQGEKPDE